MSRSRPSQPSGPTQEQIAAMISDAYMEGVLRGDAQSAQLLGSLINDTTGAGTASDPTTAYRPADLSAPTLHPWQLLSLYITTIGAGLVDIPPVWQHVAGVVVEDDAQDQAPLRELWTDLGVGLAFQSSAQWGGLFGGGGALMVTDEGPNAPPLSEPLDPNRVRELRALEVYDGWELRVIARGDRPGDGRRGLPIMYQIDSVSGWRSEHIHWTRVLEFYGHRVPPSAMGWVGTWLEWPSISVLQRCWTALRAYESQGMRNERAADRASTYIAQMQDYDEKMARDPSGMQRMLQSMSGKLGVYGILFGARGMTLGTASLNLGGFDALNQASYTRLVGPSGVPLALLFSEPPPGFSTDEKSWWTGWTTRLAGAWQGDYHRNYKRLYEITSGLVYEKRPKLRRLFPGSYRKPTDEELMKLRVLGVQEAQGAIGAGIGTVDQFAARYDGSWTVELPPPAAPRQPVEIVEQATPTAPSAPGNVAPVPTSPAVETSDLGAVAQDPAKLEADSQPTDTAAADFAAQMTEHAIPACVHGKANRCRICGIERVRVVELDDAGQPVYPVRWRAIGAKLGSDPAAEVQGDAEDYTIPDGAKGNARQVIDWREEHGDDVQGMTETGWRRARQLAQGGSISAEDVREIRAWFARHGAQKATRAVDPEFEDEPWRDAGYVSWLGWGGDTMRGYVADLRADADWTGTAYVYLDLDEAGVSAWRALQITVGAMVHLEGYEPGDLAPAAPHVTLHYLGDVKARDRAAILAATAATVGSTRLPALRAVGVTCFPAGDDGRSPVVLELATAGVGRLAKALREELAPWTTAEQHPRYRPHLTLGFARLDEAQVEAIEALDVPRDVGAASAIACDWGGRTVLSLPAL